MRSPWATTSLLPGFRGRYLFAKGGPSERPAGVTLGAEPGDAVDELVRAAEHSLRPGWIAHGVYAFTPSRRCPIGIGGTTSIETFEGVTLDGQPHGARGR